MAIAHTRTRLKGNVTLRTFPGGAFIEDQATIVQNLANAVIVGSCRGLTINQERETNNFRREFGAPFTGEPAETYPGLPKYSATLERVDLYDKNLLEAFGIDDVNIVAQYKPLILVVEQPVPEDLQGNPLTVNGSPMKRRTYILPGAWFGSMPIEFDIDDSDQKFVPEVEMIVRTVYSI